MDPDITSSCEADPRLPSCERCGKSGVLQARCGEKSGQGGHRSGPRPRTSTRLVLETILDVHVTLRNINSVQIGHIVKVEAQKSPLVGRFPWEFCCFFSKCACFQGFQYGTLRCNEAPILTNTPWQSTSLYNAPSLHNRFCVNPYDRNCSNSWHSQTGADARDVEFLCERLSTRIKQQELEFGASAKDLVLRETKKRLLDPYPKADWVRP